MNLQELIPVLPFFYTLVSLVAIIGLVLKNYWVVFVSSLLHEILVGIFLVFGGEFQTGIFGIKYAWISFLAFGSVFAVSIVLLVDKYKARKSS